MNQKRFSYRAVLQGINQIIDVLISKPTREDIFGLFVGDMAPDVFGGISKITSIFAQGIDVKGRAYVCFYAETASGLSCSGSMTEGEIVPTIPVLSKFYRVDDVQFEGLPSA